MIEPDDTPQCAEDQTSTRLVDRSRISDEVRALSVVQDSRAALSIIYQWAVAAGVLWAVIVIDHWAAFPIAVVVIATRQHAIGVLTHEAAHYRLLRNREANDLASDLLLAFPLGMSTPIYRAFHFRHHRYVNRPNDSQIETLVGPEWVWPKGKLEYVKLLCRDLAGLSAPTLLRVVGKHCSFFNLFLPRPDGARRISRREVLSLLLFTGAIVGLLCFPAGRMAIALWTASFLTTLPAIFRLRALSEHSNVRAEDELSETRTVLPTWWERILLAPYNVNYHLEHHLFPGVPWYNLPQLHKLLMQDPLFAGRAHLTQSYLGWKRGVFAELTATDQNGQVELAAESHDLRNAGSAAL
jgi:fatty acid desaturase